MTWFVIANYFVVMSFVLIQNRVIFKELLSSSCAKFSFLVKIFKRPAYEFLPRRTLSVLFIYMLENFILQTAHEPRFALFFLFPSLFFFFFFLFLSLFFFELLYVPLSLRFLDFIQNVLLFFLFSTSFVMLVGFAVK